VAVKLLVLSQGPIVAVNDLRILSIYFNLLIQLNRFQVSGLRRDEAASAAQAGVRTSNLGIANSGI
jgi:hypothetical protein